MSYAVCVTFILHPDERDAFLDRVRANARASLEREPGCQVFDVLSDPGLRDRVFLYEIYDDRAAFDAHRATDHFRAFDDETPAMVADKIVTTWSEVSR